MQKILENWKIVWWTEFDPVLEDWQTAEEAQDWEYEAWLEEQKQKEPHFVTIEIPLTLLATNEDLQKKLVFLRLVYSHMETVTRNGVTYLSHIDITDIKGYLPYTEYKKRKGNWIKFPPEVHALYVEEEKNEKPTA